MSGEILKKSPLVGDTPGSTTLIETPLVVSKSISGESFCSFPERYDSSVGFLICKVVPSQLKSKASSCVISVASGFVSFNSVPVKLA
jgi:hypothetical protein